MLNVVIVDDEQDAREALLVMLTEFCTGVNVIGQASNPLEAIKLINNEKPNVIFLDIEMPGGTGFDVIEATPNLNYKVIFTTAYNHYAIKAIKFGAMDYLMKPIDIDELEKAVDQAKEHIETNHSEAHRELLLAMSKNKYDKIALCVKDGYVFVPHEEIQYLQSEGSYTKFVSEKEYVVSKNLKTYEDILPSDQFVRISNSHLVNINNIKNYLREDGGTILMKNGSKIAISRAKKNDIKERLGI